MLFRRSKEPKRPAQAKTVILRFAHKSQATVLGHTKFASNNFSSKYRGQKNSLFTEEQQQDMHRSNNICPISAIWTVVCCVFDSAGFFIGITYAGENIPYTSLKNITSSPQTLQVNRYNLLLRWCHPDDRKNLIIDFGCKLSINSLPYDLRIESLFIYFHTPWDGS